MKRGGILLAAAAVAASCADEVPVRLDAAPPPKPQHVPYCPETTPLAQIRCAETMSGAIASTDAATLGGACGDELCYSCGDPFAAQEQLGVEDVYEFWCQRTGPVTIEISGITCDFDYYVLDVFCAPFDHCLAGDTSFGTADRTLTFDCATTLVPYYIVVERGLCSEGGDYTLSIPLDGATCLENCTDEIDNDGDSAADCSDIDCATHPGCPCDVDGDGSFAESCGGDDCNDEDDGVFPGRWDGCDGIDNDCDGELDESPAIPCAPDAGPPDAAPPPDAAVPDAAVPDAAVPDAAPPPPDAAPPPPDAAPPPPDAAAGEPSPDCGCRIGARTSRRGPAALLLLLTVALLLRRRQLTAHSSQLTATKKTGPGFPRGPH